MSISALCNREVIIIGREASIPEAAKLMRGYHVGDLVVVVEKAGLRLPVGILSDRDIVVEVLAQEVEPAAVSVGDIMSTDLVTAREEEDLLDVARRMKLRGVRRVPVVDDRGTLVGILAADDLVELISEQLGDLVGLINAELRHEREKRSG